VSAVCHWQHRHVRGTPPSPSQSVHPTCGARNHVVRRALPSDSSTDKLAAPRCSRAQSASARHEACERESYQRGLASKGCSACQRGTRRHATAAFRCGSWCCLASPPVTHTFPHWACLMAEAEGARHPSATTSPAISWDRCAAVASRSCIHSRLCQDGRPCSPTPSVYIASCVCLKYVPDLLGHEGMTPRKDACPGVQQNKHFSIHCNHAAVACACAHA
jgi:hypothetical protein